MFSFHFLSFVPNRIDSQKYRNSRPSDIIECTSILSKQMKQNRFFRILCIHKKPPLLQINAKNCSFAFCVTVDWHWRKIRLRQRQTHTTVLLQPICKKKFGGVSNLISHFASKSKCNSYSVLCASRKYITQKIEHLLSLNAVVNYMIIILLSSSNDSTKKKLFENFSSRSRKTFKHLFIVKILCD